jgi:hypothetical protein
MPTFTVRTPDGFEIVCTSAPDAAAMYRALTAQSANVESNGESAPRLGRPLKNSVSMRELDRIADLKATVAFLEIVACAGAANADEVVKALGLKGSRGIGGAVLTVKRILREHGFANFDEVIVKRKDANGTHWLGGPKSDEARVAIKKAFAALSGGKEVKP